MEFSFAIDLPESKYISIIFSIYSDMVFGKTDVLEVGAADVLYINIVSVARALGKL